MLLKDIDAQLLAEFRKGTVIPAMPLALDGNRKFDEDRQKALVRYYMDAGAGGIATGVHSTQFEIREPQHNLFKPVLSLVSKTADEWTEKTGKKVLKVAGICGKTQQAADEAEFAVSEGYHAGLLSLTALKGNNVSELIEHCRKIAAIIPVIGFYLQESVGGAKLPLEFWREFAKIPNVLGIKMAPFNRYRTIDVIRGVCEAGKENEITLYSGNDDNIIIDLLTEYKIQTPSGLKKARIKGGLLGHWCVWTKKAVELLKEIHYIIDSGKEIPAEMLSRNIAVTDTNAVLFDAANGFAGCIPGIHEVLRRQGLLKGTWCLNPHEILSPGQSEEFDRIYKAYPDLNDDDFVKANLDKWLK